ncbi:MAG TPA: 1-(5-phosphoribosyl)-5-[(5-phosphoribosylamino)methylideneamino]imidazole-4-carboxamide isomerase [Anaerolineaceae bacterium]
MNTFTIFPAVDLRGGRVVRLQMGDPARQTVYSSDPEEAARRWIASGARWLHVVNLDGAFGEKDQENQAALVEILRAAAETGVNIQFGGGLRSLEAVERTLALGVERAVLGTAAVENPALLREALQRWGPGRVAASLDARGGIARVRGWQAGSERAALDLAGEFQAAGLQWLVYTDIDRDGLASGVNLEETTALASHTGLRVIASGGVRDLEDIRRVRASGLSGVIVGQALYAGKIDAVEMFAKE